MRELRREFLKMAGMGVAGGAGALLPRVALAQAGAATGERPVFFDVRQFGAKGDGATIDSPAIDAAIGAAGKAGGGTVIFPAGVYACYSIHLQSNVALFLQQGATILAASTPYEGTSSGYDNAEPQGAWEPYQDFGHNHWHNSLIWGEGLHDIGIFGPGLIYGKGLSRGWDREKELPDSNAKGVGNKAIALKNCRNVILSDFSILQGGWFGILATGVDNMTIDNLKIDTNRDGVDIDCCRNVRVSNCTVNSPWDDGICPKSSYALGQARATENLTISNCYVTGGYELGSVLDGTWKLRDGNGRWGTGRIKCGTESNGGFKNITIANCVFEKCHGFALETVDGAIAEDITITNITMRDVIAPFFLRLGARLRGPKPDTVPGRLKRVLISNVTSSGAAQLPSMIAGIEGHPVEDIKISNVYLEQAGGGTAEMAALRPEEKANAYPEPTMFGMLPATGWYMRHVKNVEMSNVEIATVQPDARAAFYVEDVAGADFFRLRLPGQKEQFRLKNVSDFRVFGCRHYADNTADQTTEMTV
ncbi:MAG TPA: glycoside hydrolase family 28 protein [Terracidiphilus sp.]|jgi:polygalacturonase